MPFADPITDVDGLRQLYRQPHDHVLEHAHVGMLFLVPGVDETPGG